MTHSSPWKIPTINGGVVRWENHQFLWAMASMAMLNNQRVYIYIWWLNHYVGGVLRMGVPLNHPF